MQIYKHDIELYQQLRCDGLTWREIAKKVGIKEHSVITNWVKRNYVEFYYYMPRKKQKN